MSGILAYCPIDTLQWGSTHSAVIALDIVIVAQKVKV